MTIMVSKNPRVLLQLPLRFGVVVVVVVVDVVLVIGEDENVVVGEVIVGPAKASLMT